MVDCRWWMVAGLPASGRWERHLIPIGFHTDGNGRKTTQGTQEIQHIGVELIASSAMRLLRLFAAIILIASWYQSRRAAIDRLRLVESASPTF